MRNSKIPINSSSTAHPPATPQSTTLEKIVEALLLSSIKDVFRIVNRATDGALRITDFPNPDSLLQMHTQIGVEDSSTDLALRGMPVFRGLIGPIPEGRNIVRYETPEVFEAITKEWSSIKVKRRRRRAVPAGELAAEPEGTENSLALRESATVG